MDDVSNGHAILKQNVFKIQSTPTPSNPAHLHSLILTETSTCSHQSPCLLQNHFAKVVILTSVFMAGERLTGLRNDNNLVMAVGEIFRRDIYVLTVDLIYATSVEKVTMTLMIVNIQSS